MSYVSINFLIFIIVLALIYYLFPKKYRYFILLIGSIYFYFLISKQYIIFIILSSIVIYLSARLMNKYEKKKKLILVISVLVNLGFLAVLKYNNFFASLINPIFKVIAFKIPYHKFILPIGISYYTLEAISYVTDVYRKKYPSEKNYFKVLLYLIYFPTIVEGPISNYGKLSKTLFNQEKFNYDRFVSAGVLIFWGFFKKLVIADRAGIFVESVFQKNYGGSALVVAIILYTIQLYADFSGSIDVVRGTSEIFGIDLEENFKRPFFSKSIQEFWRRWHITLGAWLKNYIFFPISLSKVNMKLNSKLRKWKLKHVSKFIITAFPLLFVWFANGLWHGASWKYVLYGMYYYVLMMLGILFAPVLNAVISLFKINTKVWSYKLFQALRTTIIVCFGMFLFRVSDINQMITMINNKASVNLLKLGLKQMDFIILFVGVFVLLVVSILQEFNIDVRKSLNCQNLVFRWIIYYILIFAIIIFGVYGPGYSAQSFIYGGF